MNQVTLHCPHCGAHNRNDSYFCHICGCGLRADAVQQIQSTPDVWRIPLISLCSALGVVAVLSLMVNVAFISQKPLTQNNSNSAAPSLYQAPSPFPSVTPISNSNASAAVANKKSKLKPSPTPSDNYVVPSDEPEYIPTPPRSEAKSLPRSTPYPEPTQYYSPTYGHTYIRGPRGGCYYINGNGNKTYVDRSMCN